MSWLPFILIVPLLCFLGAYGILRRTRWAWYAGWVIAFFVAGAVAYFALAILFNAATLQEFIGGLIFTLAGVSIWTGWAVWWANHRDEFFRKRDGQ